MKPGRSGPSRKRLALVALTSIWLSACGGGGGGGAGDGGPPATAAASSTGTPTASSPALASGPGPTAPAPAPSPAPSASGGAPAPAPGPVPDVQGTDGPDTLQATSHPAVMAGGRGDDIYLVTDPADVVIEQADGGIDEIRTSVGYTLPPNVENMNANFAVFAGNGPLVGNSLNNRITGTAFASPQIFGLDGDDILDATGRYGAYLDGGNGNDTLINNVGQSRGGPGADTFVVRPRGAHTSPEAPMTVLDFNPAEGDRIDGSFLPGDPAALFASGNLFFDAARQQLVYTLYPERYAIAITSVQQIIQLPGITSFDPAWIIRR